MGYEGRHRNQRDIEHDSHHDIVSLHMNGIHAQPVSEGKEWDMFLKDHEYLYANFYAPWCIWCQRLEPVWEAFAEEVEQDESTFHVSVVKIDCVANKKLCNAQSIQAFPTLRLFYKGVVQNPDYRGDRTVEALMDNLKSKISINQHISKLPESVQQEHRDAHGTEVYPGCLLAGFLLVNRGNFVCHENNFS